MTTEDKYKWLCQQLRIQDIDYWEHDAMLVMKPVYFQFDSLPKDVDSAVEMAMNDWFRIIGKIEEHQ